MHNSTRYIVIAPTYSIATLQLRTSHVVCRLFLTLFLLLMVEVPTRYHDMIDSTDSIDSIASLPAGTRKEMVQANKKRPGKTKRKIERMSRRRCSKGQRGQGQHAGTETENKQRKAEKSLS